MKKGSIREIIIALAIFACVMVVFGVITLNAAESSTTEDGDYEYTVLEDGTIEITKYIGTGTEVAIPETINGRNVTSIGDYTFSGFSSLTSVIIPEGVTNIGDCAFAGCGSLRSIEISSSVTSIGRYALSGCSNLTNITIPSSVTSIGDYAFQHCRSLTNITIPNNVTSIGYYAFSECSNLTTIEISNCITYIEAGVFYNCDKLTSIRIPKSVTSINSSAFDGCSNLTEIEVDSSNENYSSKEGVLFNKEKTELICYPRGKEEPTYIIPNTVTSIENWAFAGCSSLTNITISSSVMSIGDSAFGGCSNLTEIEVDSGNEKYSSKEGVLFNKEKTELICYPEGKENATYTIPNSVTSIGDYTFSGSSSLTSVIIPEGVTSIGNFVFYNCSNLTSIGYYAFYGCSGLRSITIPEGVTSIGLQAFGYCSSLRSVEISSSVTRIADYAFIGCSNLTKIEVHSSNQNYSSKEGVLFNKEKTELICYPRKKEMVTYTIPDSVTSIGEHAFSGCSNLTNITIPNSVISIGYGAFDGCSSLTSIEIPNSVTSIGDSTFEGCSSLINIEIPNSVTSIEDTAFKCSGLAEIKIPSSVTSIGDYAFSGCSNLTNIEIPSTVTSIGDSVFKNSKIVMTVVCGTDTIQEIELPGIIKRAMDEKDVLYSSEEFSLTNCTLNEDKTKLVVDTEKLSEKDVVLEVTAGELEGLSLVVVQSGTITYSKEIWTYNDITAMLHIGDGETITNNNGKNVYTFTEDGEYTFEYIDVNGDTKTATAKVTKIEGYDISEDLKYITKIKPETNVKHLEDVLDENADLYYVKVYDKYKGEILQDDIIGTGMKVDFNVYLGIGYNAIAVVTGDTDGDGVANFNDILQINKHRLNKVNLAGEYLQAGDVTEDGKVNFSDILKINKYRLGKISSL